MPAAETIYVYDTALYFVKCQLRMARRGCARLLLEEGVAVVYHCMDNSRVHHGNALRHV